MNRKTEQRHSDDSEIDSLFQLPQNEFTAARNALSSRLRKAGHKSKSEKVKALAKPSISAWAVNQLYWKNREAFTKLTDAGRRLMRAQVSQLSGNSTGMDEAQSEQREAVSILSRAADSLLRESGHTPTPDLMRRIRTNLEALSAYSSLPDAPSPGRLTEDVTPPGFESLAGLVSAGGVARPRPKSRQVVVPFRPRRAQQAEKEKDIAAAKTALKRAEQALGEARQKDQSLAAAQKKASARLKEMESNRREAEERYEAAVREERKAREDLDSVTAEAEEAARNLDEAERTAEKARKELGQ